LYASPNDFPPNIGYVVVDDLHVFSLQYTRPLQISLILDKTGLSKVDRLEQISINENGVVGD
jgi:hypothetical protein